MFMICCMLFTYNDPDGNGVDDTYGMEMTKYTGPFDIVQTWFGCGNGWVRAGRSACSGTSDC